MRFVLRRAGLECDSPYSHYLIDDDLTTSTGIPAIELATAEVAVLAIGRKCSKLAFAGSQSGKYIGHTLCDTDRFIESCELLPLRRIAMRGKGERCLSPIPARTP